MAEVKAKIEDIEALVSAIKTEKEKIDTSVSSINEPTQSKGIMVSTYFEKIKDISALLDKYKQLLEKDISDMTDSKEKFEQMDKEMKNLYESV